MRDGKQHPASARAKSALLSLAATALIAGSSAAWAQTPWTADEPSKPVAANPSMPPKAPPATTGATAAPAGTGNEDLPWLATDKPAPAGPAPATAAAPQPPAKPASKKTAALPQKCEEQAEDGCRTMKACAWVAEMPTADGKLTPARCAERKVFAPEKEKKPKPVAAKPKPKPEKPAAAVTATPEPVKTEAQPAAKPEPPKEAKADAAPAPIPDPAPVKIETPQAPAETPATTAAVPPTSPKSENLAIPVRPAVPFLAPGTSNTTPASDAPRSNAPQAVPPAPEQVASDSPPDGEKQPLSIPGLVISE